MHKTLYLKFILAYILFGVFGFIVVATFISNMTVDQCSKNRADSLYSEATLIANTYASDLYNSEVSLDSVQKQLAALGTFMSADIYIVNPSGRMVVNNKDAANTDSEVYVADFDPGLAGNGKNYFTDNFFAMYEYMRLSVIAPITGDYVIRGYVCITAPYSAVLSEPFKPPSRSAECVYRGSGGGGINPAPFRSGKSSQSVINIVFSRDRQLYVGSVLPVPQNFEVHSFFIGNDVACGILVSFPEPEEYRFAAESFAYAPYPLVVAVEYRDPGHPDKPFK